MSRLADRIETTQKACMHKQIRCRFHISVPIKIKLQLSPECHVFKTDSDWFLLLFCFVIYLPLGGGESLPWKIIVVYSTFKRKGRKSFCLIHHMHEKKENRLPKPTSNTLPKKSRLNYVALKSV